MAHETRPTLSQRGQQWLKHIKQWQKDNTSQAEYCRKHTLSAPAFGWWKRKLKQEGYLQVRRDRGTPGLSPEKPSFIELPELPGVGIQAPCHYQIDLPGQKRLGIRRGFDPTEVDILVSLLERSC